MPISQIGQINTTALQVADVYVQIVPPRFLLNGVPSNILALLTLGASRHCVSPRPSIQ